MRHYPEAACAVDKVLLPGKGVDPTRWAVVACDQYTSRPEYWAEADRLVGPSPSTLRLVYPEAFLAEADPDARIRAIRAHMERYLAMGVLEAHDGMVYVERKVVTGLRRGLVLCLDLEQYDYSRGSSTLIRATEGTIVERIPPRVRIREGAPIESPHIMVLIDDPQDQVIGPLAAARARLPRLYDFDLMADSGHLDGWLVDDLALEEGAVRALASLADPEAFRAKYGLSEPSFKPLLYAMGDGNHSLATARAIWERVKTQAADPTAVMGDPRRFALVELVNVYDASLVFEPIHRVLFECREDLPGALRGRFGEGLRLTPAACIHCLEGEVRELVPGVQRFGLITPEALFVAELSQPPTALAVGSLQAFLDPFVKGGGAREIDYVHDTDEVLRLGTQPGNVGFYLPPMEKSDLFRSVILDGALPRKTFSMGESRDKRFYMECRRIDGNHAS
jgi:hypothetical protein